MGKKSNKRGAQSKPVEGDFARPVYEALTELECGSCQEPISEGEWFIRKKLPGGGHRNFAVCQRCERLPGYKHGPQYPDYPDFNNTFSRSTTP